MTIRPRIRLNFPSRISCINLHSNEAGLSVIRGGATRSLGAVWSPTAETSLTCGGNGIELARILSAAENGTRLTTNSSVARMLRQVSLGCLAEFQPTPM